MNTNNYMKKIVLLALCTATASTQCMLNSIKTVINGVGTAIGVSLPTVPFLMYAKSRYTGAKNPDTYMENVNKSIKDQEQVLVDSFGVGMYTPEERQKFDQKMYSPSPAEEKFLRQYIPEPTRIVMNPIPGTSASASLSNFVTVENQSFASEKTLEQALEQQDHETLKIFAALAQHENEHVKNKDSLKKTVPLAVLPVVTTAAAVKGAKKVFPYNKQKSLVRHVGRLGAKTAGGAALLGLNACLEAGMFKKISNELEFNADQGITPENVEGLKKHLFAVEKRMEPVVDAIDSVARQKLPSFINTKELINQFDRLHHPSHEARIAALENRSKKV